MSTLILGLGVFGTGGFRKPALLLEGLWLLLVTFDGVLFMSMVQLILLLPLLLKMPIAEADGVEEVVGFSEDWSIIVLEEPGGRHISNPGVPPTD